MKILFYYYRGGGGGLSNILLLLRALARRHPENSIEIVTASADAFDGLRDAANIHVRAVRVTGRVEVDRLLLGMGLLPRLARQIGANLIWAVNLGPYVRTRIPFVLSIHNPHQVYPWEVTRLHPSARWRVAALRWFFRRSLRACDAAIVQTAMMRDYLDRVAGVPDQVCIAPKAVEANDDVEFEELPPLLKGALESGLGPRAFTFLYVSTWSPHKNHATILQAFSRLAAQNVRARVVVTVSEVEVLSAGWPGSQVLIDRGYVVPVSSVDKAHLRSLYAACDACLMPSLLESLSSAHLEAMRWGRPQIAADLPYARDACGAAALYASALDPQDWSHKIEQLMKSEPLRAGLINAGFEHIRSYPESWDTAAETVYTFLESVERTAHAGTDSSPLRLGRWQREH